MSNLTLLSGPAVLTPSPFAVDRLLRLQSLIRRQHNTDRLMYGPDREQGLALLNRAIVSTYNDCRAAGVEDEALRLLLHSQDQPATPLSIAA